MVTTVVPETATSIPPGPVDANGAFNVSSTVPPGVPITVTGTFKAGHVEGQIIVGAGALVCPATFSGERV